MTGFSWTQLGAYVIEIANVDNNRLDKFKSIGGRWIVPVMFGDNASGPRNIAAIPDFKKRCNDRDIWVGHWANAFGQDPVHIADEIKAITDRHALSPVVVDAESAYQNNTKMSYLMGEMRRVYPIGSKAIALSTNSCNNSVVYNGRKGASLTSDDKSFRDLNIAVHPQWYASPTYSNWKWSRADQNMAWVQAAGMADNWYDPKYTDHRAVMQSQIHGTLEVTGMESASLKEAIDSCVVARQKFALPKGISVYTLENMPDSDFQLLAAQRGFLYA